MAASGHKLPENFLTGKVFQSRASILPIICLSSTGSERGHCAGVQSPFAKSPQNVEQGTSMSQQRPTQFSTARRAACFIQVARIVVCAMFVAGCALPEKFDQAKCRIPPNWPHDMPPPANYGFFQTLWHPWPGAEAVPGFTLNRRKSKEEEKEAEQPTGETLPEPTPEAAPGEGFEPGMNVFEEPPAERAPEEPAEEAPRETKPTEPDTTPLEQPLPDALEPPPEEAPSGEPKMPEEGLEPAAEPTPEQGAFDFDSLPDEGPEGALIPDDVETAGRRSPTPGLLMPENELRRGGEEGMKQIESVRRPAPVRGASATERVGTKQFRSSSQNKGSRRATGDAALDGPRLFRAESTDGSGATVASRGSNNTGGWLSARKPGLDASAPQKPVTSTADTTESTFQGNSATWRSKPAASEGNSPTVAKSSAEGRSDGWQRRTSRVEYPAVQTGHTEPAAQIRRPRGGCGVLRHS